MQPNIVKLSEVNIDGNGTDADNYVAFERELTWDELRTLEQYLKTVKSETPYDEQDTDTMVNDALEKFQKETGVKYNILVISELTF